MDVVCAAIRVQAHNQAKSSATSALVKAQAGKEQKEQEVSELHHALEESNRKLQELKLQKTSSLDAAKKESSSLQKQVTDLREQLTQAESAAQVSPDVLLSCLNVAVMPIHA